MPEPVLGSVLVSCGWGWCIVVTSSRIIMNHCANRIHRPFDLALSLEMQILPFVNFHASRLKCGKVGCRKIHFTAFPHWSWNEFLPLLCMLLMLLNGGLSAEWQFLSIFPQTRWLIAAFVGQEHSAQRSSQLWNSSPEPGLHWSN